MMSLAIMDGKLLSGGIRRFGYVIGRPGAGRSRRELAMERDGIDAGAGKFQKKGSEASVSPFHLPDLWKRQR
jgi:hypothetical protein